MNMGRNNFCLEMFLWMKFKVYLTIILENVFILFYFFSLVSLNHIYTIN